MLQYLRNSPLDWRVRRFDWAPDMFDIIPNDEFTTFRQRCVDLGIPIVDISHDTHDDGVTPPEKHHRRPLGNGYLQYLGILRMSTSGVAVFENGFNGQVLLTVDHAQLRDSEHAHHKQAVPTEMQMFLEERKERIEL